jgi:hypothetical protein
LYFWLSAHPEVYGSPKKETFFFADKVNRFNAEANVHEHGLERYSKFFEDGAGAAVRFEATAHYLYEGKALEAFSNWSEKPKVIFLFREPSKQMYSHYKMEKYRTKRVDLPLEEYVKLPKIANYVRYAEHLKPWMDVMPQGHVGVWMFEDMMSRKVEVMKEIAAFLGIDTSFYDGFDFEHRNESVAIRSGVLHQLGLKLQPLIPHGLQKALLPVYMKLNSGGRVQDDAGDAEVLAEFKAAWSHQGAALKELVPEFPAERWG